MYSHMLLLRPDPVLKGRNPGGISVQAGRQQVTWDPKRFRLVGQKTRLEWDWIRTPLV